jgi:hypothetical protein
MSVVNDPTFIFCRFDQNKKFNMVGIVSVDVPLLNTLTFGSKQFDLIGCCYMSDTGLLTSQSIDPYSMSHCLEYDSMKKKGKVKRVELSSVQFLLSNAELAVYVNKEQCDLDKLHHNYHEQEATDNMSKKSKM